MSRGFFLPILIIPVLLVASAGAFVFLQKPENSSKVGTSGSLETTTEAKIDETMTTSQDDKSIKNVISSPKSSPTESPKTASAPSSTNSSELSVKSLSVGALMADYLEIGPYSTAIYGNGFTNQSTVELYVTNLYGTHSSSSSGYSMTSVKFVSAGELRANFPAGLYNSYYGVRVKNPDGKQAQMDNVLLVSGSTSKQINSSNPQ